MRRNWSRVITPPLSPRATASVEYSVNNVPTKPAWTQRTVFLEEVNERPRVHLACFNRVIHSVVFLVVVDSTLGAECSSNIVFLMQFEHLEKKNKLIVSQDYSEIGVRGYGLFKPKGRISCWK